jgi:hypothetical protein
MKRKDLESSEGDAWFDSIVEPVPFPKQEHVPKKTRTVRPPSLDDLFSSDDEEDTIQLSSESDLDLSEQAQPLKRKRDISECDGTEEPENEGVRKIPRILSFHSMYNKTYEYEMAMKKKRAARSSVPRKHEYQLNRYSSMLRSSGDKRLSALRSALEQLDHLGFMRSAHQRQFHESFIGACLPQIYGEDLEKNLVRILRSNNMEEIRCEIMVCCPRRWGKTMAVALFAAAYLWSQPDAEVLIYSIAKRTSSMLMAKVYNMIVKLAGGTHIVRTHNQEDLEIVNAYGRTSMCHSYPAASKISTPLPFVNAHARVSFLLSRVQ